MKLLPPSKLLSAFTAALVLSAASGFGQTWKFIAVGDTRGAVSTEPVNSTIVGELTNEIIKQGVAFVIIPGDLVYSGSLANFQAWRSAMSAVYNAGIGVYPVLGNHDANDVASFIQVFGADLPDNGPAGEVNRTYAFTYNNALVLGLDEYVNIHRVNQTWINSMFTQNTLPHVFVFGHEPAFKANHADCLDDYPSQRDAFWNSLKNNGAAVYFCGHDHFYDHARIDDGDGDLNNDVHQLIVGGGGAPLYTSYAYDGANTTWHPVNIFHDNQYGYTLVEVNGPTVTLTYYHRTGANSYRATTDVWSYTVNTTPPPVPTGLTATPGDAKVSLTWNASPGATSYNVLRSASSPSGPWVTVATVAVTSYTDTSVVNGTTYYYAVTALNGAGESASSAYVSATPQAPVVPGPFTLTATSAKKAIALSWTPSSGASSYTVKRSTTSGGSYTTIKTGVTSLKYNDQKARAGVTYYYIVTAVNSVGQTDSNEASATKSSVANAAHSTGVATQVQ